LGAWKDLALPVELHILVLLAFVVLLAWAAGEDMRRLIIPDWISLGIAGLYPLHVLTSPVTPSWLIAAGLAALALVIGFVLFGANVIGGGDVKLMAAVTLWAGPIRLPLLIIATALAGGIVALLLLLFRWGKRIHTREKGSPTVIPYGVAIAAGGLVVALSLSRGG
jgi:prepilin peptidase CpaA